MTTLTVLLTSSCRGPSFASNLLMRFTSSSIWTFSFKICCKKCPIKLRVVTSLKTQIQMTSFTRFFSFASSSIISGIPPITASHFSSVRATVFSASFFSAHRWSCSTFRCLNSSLPGKPKCFTHKWPGPLTGLMMLWSRWQWCLYSPFLS